ncbi:unnamed protein product [Closterium sp. NIES-53]
MLDRIEACLLQIHQQLFRRPQRSSLLSPSSSCFFFHALPRPQAMRDRIEACLLQIHQQDFSSDDPNAPPASTTPPPPGSASRNRTSSGGTRPPQKHNYQQQQHESAGDNCSPYMENTIRAITHFHNEFLSKLLLPDSSSTSSSAAAPASSIFAASLSGAAGSGPLSPSTALPPATVSEPVAQSLAKRLASRTLLFFVRHASLVRPLSEAGRLRLARDMGELEFAVGQHLFPTHALGASYRALRAFRPLLFVDLEKIPTSSLLQDLPPSVVLHHLFSRAPPELLSPFTRIQQPPARYSLWLDQHSQQQAWQGIKASVDDYVGSVKARGGKEFHPVYAVMLQLGQTLLVGGNEGK